MVIFAMALKEQSCILMDQNIKVYLISIKFKFVLIGVIKDYQAQGKGILTSRIDGKEVIRKGQFKNGLLIDEIVEDQQEIDQDQEMSSEEKP